MNICMHYLCCFVLVTFCRRRRRRRRRRRSATGRGRKLANGSQRATVPVELGRRTHQTGDASRSRRGGQVDDRGGGRSRQRQPHAIGAREVRASSLCTCAGALAVPPNPPAGSMTAAGAASQLVLRSRSQPPPLPLPPPCDFCNHTSTGTG
jgi:hypothetical protein